MFGSSQIRRSTHLALGALLAAGCVDGGELDLGGEPDPEVLFDVPVGTGTQGPALIGHDEPMRPFGEEVLYTGHTTSGATILSHTGFNPLSFPWKTSASSTPV